MSDSLKLDALLKKLRDDKTEEDRNYDKILKDDLSFKDEIEKVRGLIKENIEKSRRIAGLLQKAEYYNSLHLIQIINRDIDIYKMLIFRHDILQYLQRVYKINNKK